MTESEFLTPHQLQLEYQFIVVHGGAGSHSVKTEGEVKRALKSACTTALNMKANANTNDSNTTTSPIGLVESAIKVLEDDGSLNAGYGSNLTLDGTVECDASIMSSSSTSSGVTGQSAAFGGVGALSGVKNPISAAHIVLKHSQVKDRLGRVPPLTLVSSGAHAFVSSRGAQTTRPEEMVSDRAREQWTKWRARLDASSSTASPEHQNPEEDREETEPERMMQDTVGAIAVDLAGNAAAGVSSGGLLLKYPGRVGEAAVYGAGCWAAKGKGRSVACSVSGTGEHIIRTALARQVGEALSSDEESDPHEVLERVLSDFWTSSREQGDDSPSAGLIVLTTSTSGAVEPEPANVRLWCAFTTESMAVGYSSTRSEKPKVTESTAPRKRADDHG